MTTVSNSDKQSILILKDAYRAIVFYYPTLAFTKSNPANTNNRQRKPVATVAITAVVQRFHPL